MPVNYQQALQQIRDMGKQAPKEHERLQQLIKEAQTLFGEYACELDTLEQLVERAAAENKSLRCAAPFSECLNQTFPTPQAGGPYALLAADGSQINPDRHAAVEFGAINVGAIRMKPGQGAAGLAPEELVQSQMMFLNDLFTANGNPLTDDIVALKRDLAERRLLFKLAQPEREGGAAVVTLTDGPLELYGTDQNSALYKQSLEEYLGVMRQLARTGAAAAGYVDKPRSSYVVNMLEWVLLERQGELSKAGQSHPLFPVHDDDLFAGLIGRGQRSAVFGLRSSASARFSGELGLHFFYINVGRETKPHLARVEIPLWVAEDRDLLALLHAVLLEQSRQMGARPYPYILHRAHEVAVVSFDERDQIETMIQAELRRQGVETGEKSNKQSSKDLEGRTRLNR